MKKYILALDEGTTSARAILFDLNFNAVAIAQHPIKQIYPHPGWVEQDPLEIYSAQTSAMVECVTKSGVNVSEIACVGITNQRETTIVWDKLTGKPIYNAIVWQCRRTADIIKQIESDGYADYIALTTGLKMDAYFSASKIKWILDNVVGAREKAEKGELLFGTVDTFLLWKSTSGKVHLTDRTNASRTMLYNIKTDQWDDKLLKIFNIPKSMLPTIKPSGDEYGSINLLGETLTVTAVAGDQQSALFGQACFEKGEAKCTYGTGCFLLAGTGDKPVKSSHGLITTVTAGVKGEPINYALEGSVFVGGAVISWLRDELKIISSSKESEEVATSVDDSGGVYVVPAFTGFGAPYWDMDARGTIVGLTRGTGRAHLVRASLESIAYQTEELISAINKDLGESLKQLKVDGGASNNRFLMQFQSDISNLEVVKLKSSEATAMGVAMLAGLTCGVFSSKEEICAKINSGERYQPKISSDKRNDFISGWQKAVRQTLCK